MSILIKAIIATLIFIVRRERARIIRRLSPIRTIQLTGCDLEVKVRRVDLADLVAAGPMTKIQSYEWLSLSMPSPTTTFEDRCSA